jgi:hypothetical protein
MKNFASAALKKAAEAVSPVTSATSKMASSAIDQATGVAMDIENGYKKAAEVLQQTKDSVINTGKTMAAMTVFIIEAGAVIAPFVAPVPVIVGVTILALLSHALRISLDENQNQAERKKAQRLAKIISRYGKIPETATVRTDYLDLTINSKTGEVGGKVRQEGKIWIDLGQMSTSDLQSLKLNINCSESAALLDALLALREASSSKA